MRKVTCKAHVMPIKLERGTVATVREWWDWERESYIWEVREEMAKWGMSFRMKLMTEQLLFKKDGNGMQLLLSSNLHHPIWLLKLCWSKY